MNTDVVSNSPEHLLQAFSETDYRARVRGGDHVVHPGRTHASLDQALAGRTWAIVTAFNPNASRLEDAANRQRHQRLLQAIAGLGLESHPTVNVDPAGEWPDETAVLIVDANIDELDALATRFGQAAIVTGRAGRPARLRLYGGQWPKALPDWARRAV